MMEERDDIYILAKIKNLHVLGIKWIVTLVSGDSRYPTIYVKQTQQPFFVFGINSLILEEEGPIIQSSIASWIKSVE
jgi:hypothetical protein